MYFTDFFSGIHMKAPLFYRILCGGNWATGVGSVSVDGSYANAGQSDAQGEASCARIPET